jgi:FtsH-binding integral membrane protein
MATDAEKSSTEDERDESEQEEVGAGGEDEKSQGQMAEDFEQERQQQYAESRRKIGTYMILSCVLIVVIGLIELYLASGVENNHPQVEELFYLLGVVNLVLALAFTIRKNLTRTAVLVVMPINFIVGVICFTVVPNAVYALLVLSLVVLFLMFRQPVLDEYDAPKE